MRLELVPAKSEHVPHIARIAFEAFKQVAEAHGFLADFPSLEVARDVLGMLTARADFYGVVALYNGVPVGSNFLTLPGPVAGIGPLTVDCARQSEGIGRALMENVLAYARDHAISQVRLTQDSYNLTSFALYSSLGFEFKEAIAWMRCPSSSALQGNALPTGARCATQADVPAMEALSARNHKQGRGQEIAANMRYGFPAFVRERDGNLVGYLLPGEFGHGAARGVEDALAVIQEAGLRLPPKQASFLCPLSQSDLVRASLQAGCRVLRILTYMASGPYAMPDPVWMPSVLY